MIGMDKDDQKRYLKICGVYECDYEAIYIKVLHLMQWMN